MKLLASIIALLCAAGVSAMAQGACSTHTIRGTYAVACSGSLTPAPGAPAASVKILGLAEITAQGYVTAEGTMTLGGIILGHSVEGQAQVNSNCTGTVRYTQKINGDPGPDINIKFVILDSGKMMRGLAVDQGSVLSCKLERL